MAELELYQPKPQLEKRNSRSRTKLRLRTLTAAFAAIAVLSFGGLALAVSAGQIEGGDIYRARNVTKNTDFTDPATATCNDTVQFKVRIHNPGPDALTGVHVAATLSSEQSTSHSSTVTVSADNANPTSTTDTAGLNLDQAGSLTYVAGTTELLDAHDAKITTLGDTILGTGVDVPNGVGVSTEQMRFVQFEVKVSCPQPPQTPPTPPTVTPPTGGQGGGTTTVSKTTAAPTTLVNTGPGQIVVLFILSSLAGIIGYRRYLRRQLA